MQHGISNADWVKVDAIVQLDKIEGGIIVGRPC